MKQKMSEAQVAAGVAIAGGVVAVLVYAGFRARHDQELSVKSIKSTLKDAQSAVKEAAKDIDFPSPVSAADVNKFFANQGDLLADATRKEQEVIAGILEDTAKRIETAKRRLRKHLS